VPAGTGTSMQMLISGAEGPNFAMRRFRIDAGGHMPAHTNEVEHEQYVLSGHARVGIGANVCQVQGGDVVLIPARVPHWYRTVGDEPFVFLCLVPNRPDEIRLVGKT
jgi:quercetin dioxygenase-like cupin family protein